MKPEQAQFLFDSALRSQFAWKYKASQFYRVGLRTLESAAASKEKSKAIHNGASRALSAEEIGIFEEFRLYDVGFLLIALAIENLLKGVWVGRNHARINGITNIRKDLDGLAGHELSEIAKDAGIELSVEEVGLLNALSACIIWSGRYPVPMKSSEYNAYFEKGGIAQRFIKDGNIHSMDLPMPPELDALISKLIDELRSIPEEQTG